MPTGFNFSSSPVESRLYSYSEMNRGSVWGWGENSLSELGVSGDTTNRSSPIQILPENTGWLDMSGGISSPIYLIDSGRKLWTWGTLSYGGSRSYPVQYQNTDEWVTVRSNTHTLGIKTDGTLWSWGTDLNGRLGFGDATTRLSPEQIIDPANTWNSISMGDSFSAALNLDGKLYTWGRGGSGQLGSNSTSNRSIPTFTSTGWKSVSCGASHLLALDFTGKIWSCGNGGGGRLGLGDVTSRSVLTQIGTDTNWAAVYGGKQTSYAVKTNGTLWAWGSASYGMLGSNDAVDRSSPIQIGAGTDWLGCRIEANATNHVLAIKADGTAWAWGDNGRGQLGVGNVTQRSSPTQIGSATDWKFASTLGQFSSVGIRGTVYPKP